MLHELSTDTCVPVCSCSSTVQFELHEGQVVNNSHKQLLKTMNFFSLTKLSSVKLKWKIEHSLRKGNNSYLYSLWMCLELTPKSTYTQRYGL